MNVHPKPSGPLILSGRDVTAVLGPTNTGKTHLAIERLVAHPSGVIGLPLRLLAREVYGRVVEKVGVDKVALVTGEEKIVPPGARYSVCTVEAMPRETNASFVAIDEVQLANDLERGHVFTDRILNLRGRDETLLLGAATMRGILEKLLRGISVVTRPRLSHLAYSGSKKLTRLPHRTAIVAFSADEVYAIGELIRRQRGGAAVVLGALSPRTRNAQVELYQSGDVDFIVATDAIGMGLNLDVDHVAFAQNRKFDGYQYRELTAAELGQIAGRAGRHVRDGTFGVTGRVDPFDEELVRKIEGHEFDPVRVLQWRTTDFDFSTIEALKRSIETPAPVDGLIRALPAVDAQALDHLSREEDVRRLATTRERVALLWEACALPDYRKIAPAQHADLIMSMYDDLVRLGHVDETYMAEQVRRADSTDGDIDTLSHRIAQIRTWTFVSNRPGWLADPAHWQEKTRDIEDRLSDALHERLTKRFVDRRTSVLMRRLRENAMPEAEVSSSGAVLVEGHHVGELAGFRFSPDQSAGGEDAKAVKTAAQKALAAEFEARAERFAAAGNSDFALGSDGVLRYIGAPVGTLVATDDQLRPRLVLLADEQLTGPARDKVQARAERYVNFQIETLLKPLVDLKGADALSGIARGIAFQLVENFGTLNRRDIAEEMRTLDQEGRAALRKLGVRFGAYHIFVPSLVKPGPAGLISLLWALKFDGKDKPGFGDVVHSLAAGRTSVVIDPTYDRTFYRLAGFRTLGRRAVRIDILERLADLIRPALAWKAGLGGARPEGAYDGQAFMVTPAMMSILGANADDMEDVLKGLGYRSEAKPAADVKAKLAAQDEASARAASEKAAAVAAEKLAAEKAVADADAVDVTPAEPGAGTSEGTVTVEANAGPVVAVGNDVEVVVAEAEAPPIDNGLAVEAMYDHNEAAELAAGPAGAGDAAIPNALIPEVSAPVEATLDEPVAAVEPDVAAEPPKPILLWRPGRSDRGPRRDNQRAGGRDAAQARPKWQDRRAGGAPVSPEDGAARASTPGEKPVPGGRQRFDKRSRGSPGERSGGKPEVVADQPTRFEKRPDGDRQNAGRGRGDRHGRDADRAPRDGKPSFDANKSADRKPREERAPRFDPDSPFAKLAALRDQLKK